MNNSPIAGSPANDFTARGDGPAVEMEGVAQASETLGVPWIVIRALSDLAGRDSSLDFAALASGVTKISTSIVHRILPAL